MQSHLPKDTLIIGYGNTLRSDDGVGYKIAETVESWELPGVLSVAVHQLTPELAAEIAQVQQVIFVDACPNAPGVQVTPLTPSEQDSPLGHATSPQSLLTFSQLLYQSSPPAYWVLVPAQNFEFGEVFSALTAQSIPVALNEIQRLVQRGVESCPSTPPNP